jgi:hypothetical protein
MNIPIKRLADSANRRNFIGGSDARIIMGQDEKALIRLWMEKRGEVGPEDLSANFIVQLGVVTEDVGADGAVRRPRLWSALELITIRWSSFCFWLSENGRQRRHHFRR